MKTKTEGLVISLFGIGVAAVFLVALVIFQYILGGFIGWLSSGAIYGIFLGFSLVILSLLLFLGMGIGYYGQERTVDRLEKSIKKHRDIQNYCYACGTDIKESRTAATCPKCNSKLDLWEIIN